MMRIILLCFVATEFIAEEIRKDLFKKTLHELMEIEVTSVTKTELDYRTSPSAVLVYTHDDFKNYPGTRLVDFLRNILGAQVFYSSRSSLNFSLRGSVSQFSNKLQVLINGQSITSFPFSGIFWTDYDIPLAWIERIEVLKGQHGAVWGSNNVNGV
ncbi:MAG: Plug domain-containing protein, partial [Deltaproteobacteria bacterium]|nr:Plug domain-containing protein [Deltaproteobacteria bacterium]